MWPKKDRCSWANLGFDGEADSQGYYSLKGWETADWAGARWPREDLGPEGAWKQCLIFRTDSPLHILGCGAVLAPWAPPVPTSENKTHRYLVILKVENQGLLSSILCSLVFLLLGKQLDAKPKSWLHPVSFRGNCTSNWKQRLVPLFSFMGCRWDSCLCSTLAVSFLVLEENLDIIPCFGPLVFPSGPYAKLWAFIKNIKCKKNRIVW